MYKLAEYFGEKLAEALQYDQDQKEVITYGLLAIIQFIIVMTLIIVLSSLLGTVVPSLILSFSVSALRVNAGGAHLSSIWVCSMTGVVICIVMPTVIKLLGGQSIDTTVLFAVTNIILLLTLWVVAKKAPVDHPNKRITSAEKRKELKRKSLIVVAIYFLLSNFFIIRGLNIYVLCMLFGVVWQSFTMISVGHNFLKFLEARLKK